jgi:hypothetical protein
MRTCHACQRELQEASYAIGCCEHCGAVIRQFPPRTIDDKKELRGKGGASDAEDDSAVDLTGNPKDRKPLSSDDAGATIDLSPEDTAAALGGVDLTGKPVDESNEPVRKSPTVTERSDMTIEYAAPEEGDSPSESHNKPTRRSTHSLERDLTIDLEGLPPEEAERLHLEWRGTIDRDSRQGQTIRQRETVTGYRSSLPVKSRYVRDKRKNGHAPPASPAEVPDYELLEIIGEGGMGVVYAATQSSIARTVAVKMLKPTKLIGDEQRDKFISEAVVTGELDHPNIVPIYDLGANDEGALFYSMKRVRGTPWDKEIQKKRLDENLSILLRVADAVAFAHAHGVVHRDLKPENVMLGDYGEVLVMDWGLARFSSAFANADAVFQPDSLGGTPAYMSPEMARGPVEKINHTSDIYLLGAILYEIIGGQPPHSGRDVMQCLMAAAQNKIDGVHYEGELKDVALRAMATQQEDRYPSVKEFQESIRVYQSHSESLVLTAHANQNLLKGREANDYQLFARALYGFQESLTLWDANERARALLAETQRDYAQCALDKGDLDLGASLLDRENSEHATILTKIDKARAERDARQRRLRLAKQAVAALLLIVVVTISISYFRVSAARNEAILQKDIAVAAEAEAVHQKDLADQQRQEAVRQKDIADQQRGRAEQQTVIAVTERQRAEDQTDIAIAERQRAEEAKQAEEYEAYVARIGLAAAKIDENAYDYALDLLEQCKPEMRNWEWGRLAHLCQLSAGSYPAAGPVDEVAYAPDGRSFATADWGGKVTVRDVQTGDERFSEPFGQYVHSIDYSPDGRRLAVGSSDSKIRILDAQTGSVLMTLAGHTDGVVSVRFSPDGLQLLSASYDNTARLWDLARRQTIQEFHGHNWWVWAAEFSPDGRRIVTASQDGKAIVWEKGEGGPAESYEVLTEFMGHDGAVYAARFSPDGRLVATGGYDNLVMIWNPDEVQPVDVRRRLDGLPDPKPTYLELRGHDGPVRSVAFSPNGQLVLSGSDDNAIRLWDAISGQPVQTLRGHGSGVQSCVFSPDGQWVLSGGKDERVRLWDLAGYQEVRVLHATVFQGHVDAVLSARFSPDGSQIVTASRDRTASLWDAQTGKRLRQFQEGHDFLASNAVFFADGKRLATGAGDNSVRVWDLANGTQQAVFAPTGRIGTLAVSPDGKWLVTGSTGNEATVWDTQTRKPAATLTGHTGEVSAVAFSPTGNLLVSGDENGNLRLWQMDAQSNQWTSAGELEGHSRTITAMRFSPDGARLITSSGDKTCGQWDVAGRRELRNLVLKHPDWVSALDVSPDGTMALTTCDDGAVRLWRLADAQLVGTLQSPDGIFNSVSFSPDGQTALVTSSADRTVKLWNLAAAGSGDAATETILDFNKLGGLIWSAQFAPDGRHLLTIGGNDAELWDRQSRRPVVRFSPHGAVASANLSPDGRLLVTGSWDHSAKIWDVASGQAIRKLDGGHDGYINTAEFSPDGSEVLTASDDGTARLWDVRSGKPLSTIFQGHGDRVLSAAYSPDGASVLTSSGDKTARIWDRATGRPKQTLAGHAWAVLCGQFSPDGRLVITGSEDNTAKIWDAQTGRELVTLPGHTSSITSVAFSPDGSRVLTGSQDNSAKLWDAGTGKEILSLPGHTQEVTSVSFSPDGRYALSASRDGTAIIWLAADWHSDEPLRTARSRGLKVVHGQ